MEKLLSLRAERRRREARRETFTTPKLVTNQRSILGPPAEGRPGPSIYNGEVSVCVSFTKRHHFPYSKDFVVSPVYSFIPYSKELVVSMFLDTFRTQRNWPFPCFLTLLYSKDLVVSHVYRHFPNSKVSGNSKTTNPLKYSKILVKSPVSGHLL